jgi:hemerythrin
MNAMTHMPAAFAWNDDFAVGHEAMDETHHEFVHCVDAMLRADESDLSATLEAFADHARRHFGEEDQAMRETGYESAGCHVDEHSAVLDSVDEVRAALARGHTHVVRSFAHALAEWFPRHATVMDLGLARWLAQRRLGGSPVVIRRRVTATA